MVILFRLTEAVSLTPVGESAGRTYQAVSKSNFEGKGNQMIKQILLGGATAVLVTGSASALTMSVTGDNRSVEANAFAGFDGDMQSGPAPASSTYDEQVNASASAGPVPVLTSGGSGGGGGFFGAVANASAGQFSEVGALSISGSGHADASGNHGEIFSTVNLGDADGSGGGGGLNFSDFSADSTSVMEILFSIDEAAAFDISGFLYSGNEVAVGGSSSDISNNASLILVDTDSNESAFKTEISNDSTGLNEQGVISAGNYRFTVKVETEVDGRFEDDLTSAIGNPTNGFGYATSAGFKGIALQLSAIDKPIPEPVTTTLAAMGLGALVLRTSRRRHS